jgi:hypothetical protein
MTDPVATVPLSQARNKPKTLERSNRLNKIARCSHHRSLIREIYVRRGTKEPYPIIADRFPAQRSYQSFRENRAVHLFFLTGKNSTRPSLNNLQLHPGPKAEPIPD